jgi:4-methyl-5(b-hydroxyethyl)-thiazole monophosphate biosynthesis
MVCVATGTLWLLRVAPLCQDYKLARNVFLFTKSEPSAANAAVVNIGVVPSVCKGVWVNKMVYVFMADGFEEIEAVTVVDILRRNRIVTKTVGVGTRSPKGAHGIVISADVTIEEVVLGPDLRMIVLPGGLDNANSLAVSKDVARCLEYADKNGRYIAAICAAPMVLGVNKLLVGKEAVCFPGFEGRLDGAIVKDADVVVAGNIITARDMGAAMPFSAALVDLLNV